MQRDVGFGSDGWHGRYGSYIPNLTNYIYNTADMLNTVKYGMYCQGVWLISFVPMTYPLWIKQIRSLEHQEFGKLSIEYSKVCSGILKGTYVLHITLVLHVINILAFPYPSNSFRHSLLLSQYLDLGFSKGLTLQIPKCCHWNFVFSFRLYLDSSGKVGAKTMSHLSSDFFAWPSLICGTFGIILFSHMGIVISYKNPY